MTRTALEAGTAQALVVRSMGNHHELFHAEQVPVGTAASGGRILSDLRSVTSIDWGRVTWELQEFSGIALRHMRVDREYQHALDEARDYAVSYGIGDDREEVVRHWQEAKSWLVAPVAVSAELLGGGGGFELLVGFTRFGNLVGMLDRMEVPEIHKHLVWMGRELKKRGSPMTICSDRFRLAVGFASALCLGASAVSQEVEPPAGASSESTHPRMDFKHPWHLDPPTKLMNQGQSGTCLVRFQVDPDGAIRAAQVVRSTGFPALDQACVQNILHQTLLPATSHGERIAEWVTWPISVNSKTPPPSERDTSGVPQIQQFFALKTNLADHPAIAREVHQHKDCRIRLWVTSEATVEKLELTQSTGIAELDQACLSVVQGAPFTAATRDGAAIGASAEVTMRWTAR